MTGPILKSTSDLTADWAKNKAYAARALDEGVGNVEISFDGDTDYQLGTDIGEKNYSRNYVFTGDVYTEQTHTFYMRDALGNVGTLSLIHILSAKHTVVELYLGPYCCCTMVKS